MKLYVKCVLLNSSMTWTGGETESALLLFGSFDWNSIAFWQLIRRSSTCVVVCFVVYLFLFSQTEECVRVEYACSLFMRMKTSKNQNAFH